MFLRRGVVEAAALEDVLLPEREEELEVRPIYGARDLDAGVGRGDTADDGGDGRPVSGQGRELEAASVLDLPYYGTPRVEDLAARIVIMKWTPPLRWLTWAPLSSVSAAKAGRAAVQWSRRVRR